MVVKKGRVIFDPASGGFQSISEEEFRKPFRRTPVTTGGGAGAPPPTPSAQKPSPEVEAVRRQEEEAQRIREEARRVGVSAEVQARRERTVVARAIRQEAEERGVDISTPVRERRFISQLQREARQPKQLEQLPRRAKPISEVQPAPKPSGLETLRRRAEVEQIRGEPTARGIAGGLVAGFGTSLITTARFGKQIVTHPVATTKGIVQSVPKIPSKLPALAVVVEEQPAFATGFVAGEVAQFKAIGLAQKGIIKGYRGDFDLMLGHAKKIIDAFPNKNIVVTSDHGERLGERGRYSHGGKLQKVIREVPWLEIMKR